MESSSLINSKKKAKHHDRIIAHERRKLPTIILPLPRPGLLIGRDRGTGEDEGGDGHGMFPLTPTLSPAFVPQGGASLRQAPGERV